MDDGGPPPAYGASDSRAWLELLVRGERSAELASPAAALAGRTRDWPAVLARARQEQLDTRLVDVLAAAGTDALPAAAREALTEARRDAAVRGLVWPHHVRRIVADLQAADVQPVVFKGAVLGVLLEGRADARGFGDVDVLVRRSRRDHAVRTLVAHGYAPQWPVPPHAHAPMRASAGVAFEAADRPSVDLHWGLGTPLVPCRLEQAGLFARTRTVDLGEGLAVRTFGPEDTLLHLCFHGAKDDWSYWQNVADVSGILRATPALDVALLRRIAARVGLRRVLRTGLALAALLGRAELPYELRPWIAGDRTAVRLAREAAARLRSGVPVDQSIRARVKRATRNRERWIDRSLALAGVAARVASRGPLGFLRDLRDDPRPALGGWEA